MASAELGWNTIEDLTLETARQIAQAFYKPSAVLAIGRGGLIPASMLTYHFASWYATLTPELHVVYASSYHKQERDEVVTDTTILDVDKLREHDKRLLIVDDIADSGSTLYYFLSIFPYARLATLIHRHGSKVSPHFCGLRTETKDWFVFPWERD